VITSGNRFSNKTYAAGGGLSPAIFYGLGSTPAFAIKGFPVLSLTQAVAQKK